MGITSGRWLGRPTPAYTTAINPRDWPPGSASLRHQHLALRAADSCLAVDQHKPPIDTGGIFLGSVVAGGICSG